MVGVLTQDRLLPPSRAFSSCLWQEEFLKEVMFLWEAKAIMLILPFASGAVGTGRRCLQRGWNRKSSTDGRAEGTVAGNHVGCTAAASTPFPCSVGPLQAASAHNAGVEAECGFHVSRADQTSQN